MTNSTFALSTNPAKTVNRLNALHNGDGNIDATDRSVIWNTRNPIGYLETDLKLDGQCNVADRSIVWNNRNLTAKLP